MARCARSSSESNCSSGFLGERSAARDDASGVGATASDENVVVRASKDAMFPSSDTAGSAAANARDAGVHEAELHAIAGAEALAAVAWVPRGRAKARSCPP